RFIVIAKVHVELAQRRAAFARRGLDDLPRFRHAYAAQRRPPRLDDARLLEGNLRQRVAELLRVVEADARDDGDQRRADVGRVEASAEADLEHGDIDATAN